MSPRRLVFSCMTLLVALGFGLAQAQHGPKVRIVVEGGIGDKWMLGPGVTLAAPGYPAAYAARGDNVCIALGYRLQPDGSTSDFTVLNQWTDHAGQDDRDPDYFDAFAQAAAAALMKWKFVPRNGSTPLPVDTVATMAFAGDKAAGNLAALRQHCAIRDLQALFVDVRAHSARRGDLNRSQLEKTLLMQTRNEMRANAARGSGMMNEEQIQH